MTHCMARRFLRREPSVAPLSLADVSKLGMPL